MNWKQAWGKSRVFSCICYVTTTQHKLDRKSQKHVFIGYCFDSKAYRLYVPLSGKITISRDVIFDEHAVWKWEAKKNNQSSQVEYEEEKVILEEEDDPTVDLQGSNSAS